MKIKNIEGLTVSEIQNEINNGAKFVLFTYTISVIILSFKRSSDVYFIRNGENGVVKGLPYTLLSLFLGWWGIPWGPIYTIQSLYSNLSGGKEVTSEVFNSISA